MIDTKDFFMHLVQCGFDFFTGVPDSLLKSLCACICDNSDKAKNITAANEGNAVGLASGYYLAKGKPAVVYMQNSGIGNAVNPLLSLTDREVYSIPLLMIVGWRGEPDTTDEPQHRKQGKVTRELFDVMGIESVILDDNYREKINYCIEYMKKQSSPIALIVRRNTFSEYNYCRNKSPYQLTREQAIEILIENISNNDIVVSTTGKTSRELFELREKKKMSHSGDFLTVGSMGHTSSIALGISLFSDRTVYCIDGDGSFIMHMGSAAVNAQNMGDNFKYVIINNGAHESVGGQPTAGFDIDISGILKSCGFDNVYTASDEFNLRKKIKLMKNNKRSAMVIFTKQGSRSGLKRPTTSPDENKSALMENLKNESFDF